MRRTSLVARLTPILALPLLVALPAAAVEGPQSGAAVRHDLSPPLRELLVPVPEKTGGATEINRHQPPQREPRPEIAGVPDALRQSDPRPHPQAATTPAPLFDIAGLSDDDNAAVVGFRIVPPDTQGDIGPDHYVQWINLVMGVWDVSRDVDGTPTGAAFDGAFGIRPGNSLWSGFGGPCEANNDGDPITLYDHLADRWFVSQFSINEGVQCIAVSQTGDPTGSYHRWEFLVSPGDNNDYPKFGLMPDAYYLSLRDFPSNDGDYASAVAFDRAAMLAGAASPVFVKFSLPCLNNDCPDGIQPPHLEGAAPPAGEPGIFSRIWDDEFDGPLTGTDGYRLWEFVADFATPANSSFTELPIVASSAPFDSTMCGFFQRNCIPQPAPGESLDPADELQMYRAQYRHFSGSHDSLLVHTTVDSTGGNLAGIRWAELRNTGGGWFLEQEGTYAPGDGVHRWMGSAAMDEQGNIALGYSASSSSVFPSVRYTTRRAGDPPGVMAGGEVEMTAGTGVQQGSSNRWGDYSAMSVDPVAGCTFWYTQEYYGTSGSFDFNTRIGAFQLPGCGETFCGDGVCAGAPDEDCDTCPADCPASPDGPSCGNGVCEPTEDCLTCALDCAGKQGGNPGKRYCCSGDGLGGGTNPVSCSDSRCTTGGFSCSPTPLTGFCCGDGTCDGTGAECDICGIDCTADPICEVPTCVPTSAKEKGPKCSNGLDDDCDGLIDGADPDC